MKRVVPFLVAMAAAASIASSACAATLVQGLGMFSPTALTSKYTGANKSFSFSFELPDGYAYSTPQPGASLIIGLKNFQYRLDGAEVPTTLQYMAFINQGFFFLFTDQIELFLIGADIETQGVVAAPTASYYEAYYDDALIPVGGAYVVTSRMPDTPVTAPVPEPAAWALMILGFGAAGLALRRRARLLPSSL